MSTVDKKVVKPMKVSKLLTDLPAVIWNEQIVPILESCGLRAPKSNFDVYRHVNMESFVDKAPDRTFVKLLALSLKRCGVKIITSKNEKDEITVVMSCRSNDLMIKVLDSIASYEAGRPGIPIQDVHEQIKKALTDR